MKEQQAIFPVCSISSKDGKELRVRYERLKFHHRITHSEVYRRGLKEIEQDHIKDLTQNNVA